MLVASSLYGYAALSAVVTGAVIANAVSAREQFYSTVVHLTTSKGSLMAMVNMTVVLGVLLGQLVKIIFFGTLRDSEVEHLNERIWPTITDTLLMMTIFRDEIGFQWGALFGVLIFFRVFAWLAADRVAYIEVNPNMTRSSYIRLLSMLFLFMAVDGSLLYYCANETLTKGPSQLLMFAFEYTLILISFAVSLVKYAFNVVDARSPGGWDNKGVCVLYLDFLSDLLRLITYASFFTIVCYHYGLPLHIVRQTWLSVRSFRKSFEAVSKYRKATENMDQRFPDATAADLQRFDSTCIVCRDEIQEGGKKLPCGHILHKKCLKRWLERSHTCPICSASVFEEENNPIFRFNQQNQANDVGDFWANNNAQPDGAAGVEEEREPVERPAQQQVASQRANRAAVPAVMTEMPQVMGNNGQIDPERMLEHMQLLQEQIGLLSDQVALIQAQLLSSLPLSHANFNPQNSSNPNTAAAAVAASPAPAAASPQPTPAAATPQGRANLTTSMPVTQHELEEMEQKESSNNNTNIAAQQTDDSPLDELRRRRLQRFRNGGAES